MCPSKMERNYSNNRTFYMKYYVTNIFISHIIYYLNINGGKYGTYSKVDRKKCFKREYSE